MCCCASKVVGTNTATCLPLCTALKAARTATSVLPKPTSPQIILSIELPDSMSDLTASTASNWSRVSTYWKLSSKFCCHGVSGSAAIPFSSMRRA